MVIAMVMLMGRCCTIFHQDTELSHTYHISLLLFRSVLPLLPPQTLAPLLQLFLHVSSSHSSIPLAFTFAVIPTFVSLLLGELHTVSSPLRGVHLLCLCPPFLSPSPLLLLSFLFVSSSITPSSSAVDSCLSRGNLIIHPSEL